jgi:pimeloyl-ACP methyl ester carboxylesterase
MFTRFAVSAGVVLAAWAALFGAAFATAATTTTPITPAPAVHHHTVKVDGLDLFYREAGPRQAPVVLLLHGFPSSSFMFRNLIPLLADRYRVIAPDYPGFGQSAFPVENLSFARIAEVMDGFTRALRLDRYALYIQDYGAPVGLRLALRHPERVTALIVQNGNAYEDGLSKDWAPLKAYWAEPTRANRDRLRLWLTPEGTREQYVGGVPADQLPRFSPDTWTLDWAYLRRPGSTEMQLDLFGDYRENVALYPRFQRFFRERRPPTLVVWGKHDVFFTVAGARAYRRDNPDAQIHLLDAGHFALETHAAEIATLIRSFLASVPRL